MKYPGFSFFNHLSLLKRTYDESYRPRLFTWENLCNQRLTYDFFFLPLYFPCRKTDTYRMYDHMCTNKQCKYLTLCKRCRYLEENLSVFLCDRFMSEYFFSEEVNSKEALTNCEWWNRKWHMPVRPTGGEGGEPVWRCDYDVPVMLQSCYSHVNVCTEQQERQTQRKKCTERHR